MEPRESFVFYRSFYDAALFLRPKERAELILAVCEYALDGKVPDLTGPAAAVFRIAKPSLDANQQRYENGKKGGRPKTGTKPKVDRGKTEREPTVTDTVTETETVTEAGTVTAAASPSGGGSASARSVPTLQQVQEAAKLRGCPELAKSFFDYYDAAGWRDSEGKPVYNWQQKLVAWQLREGAKAGRARPSWTELAEEMDREEGSL